MGLVLPEWTSYVKCVVARQFLFDKKLNFAMRTPKLIILSYIAPFLFFHFNDVHFTYYYLKYSNQVQIKTRQ